MPSRATRTSSSAPDAALAEGRERGLLALAVASVGVFGVLYAVAVRTGWGQRVDNAALAGRTTRPAVVHATDRLLNTISVSSLVLGGAAIVLIALLRGRPHLAVTAALLVAGATITTEVLKHDVLGRPRLVAPDPLGPSFPSGHSTVAMSLALGLVLVVPAAARPLTALVACGYAGLVGIGVVTAGWHRPSDVVAAYLVTTAWAAVAAALLLAWRGTTRARQRYRSLVPLVPPLLAGGGLVVLAVGFLGFTGTLVAVREEQLRTVRLDDTFAAALVAIIGAGLVLVAALLGALRGVNLDPE